MQPLSIARSALDEILAHARATHPDECCGAVLVEGGRDVVRRLTNAQARLHLEDPVANPRDAATAYALEPTELLAVVDDADRPGCALKAFYHSHTIRGAYFSGEDRARAMFGEDPAFPDVIYLVVSDARQAGEIRGFRWDEGARDFAEVAVEVTE